MNPYTFIYLNYYLSSVRAKYISEEHLNSKTNRTSGFNIHML
jgi:hypothetical protein